MQAVAWVVDPDQIRHCCGIGLSYSYDSTPSPGTSVCHRCSPKKGKTNKQKKNRAINLECPRQIRMNSQPNYPLIPSFHEKSKYIVISCNIHIFLWHCNTNPMRSLQPRLDTYSYLWQNYYHLGVNFLILSLSILWVHAFLFMLHAKILLIVFCHLIGMELDLLP